jgi:hypothetical protein
MELIHCQRLAQKYDELSPAEPFHCISEIPGNREYLKVNEAVSERFKVGEGEYYDNLELHEKIALAEVNLRTRGLVGLVLGSTVKKLYQPPDHMRKVIKEGTDVDCLVLNPYGHNHPLPFEWGVDWFVRPRDGRNPTNGLVRLCYDIGLKPGTKISRRRTRHKDLPFYLDAKELQLKYRKYPDDLTGKIVHSTREKLGAILPGLYLPPAAIMGKIAKTAEDRNGYIAVRLEKAGRILSDMKGAPPSEDQVYAMVKIINELSFTCSRSFRWDIIDKYALGRNLQDPDFCQNMLLQIKEIYDELKDQHEGLVKDDYSYLVPETESTRHCLYPVLDEEYLQFKPLIAADEA